MTLTLARNKLKQHADAKRSVNFRKFFKYCQDDIFLGVPAATIRKIAKESSNLSLNDIAELMKSRVHDERSMANAILCHRFRKGDENEQKRIFTFYLRHRNKIKDWDGVDDSAPYIVGPYLLTKDKTILYELAVSKRIWDRRIAIVATWWFIRQNQFDDTLKIAELLLHDDHDLIHKASGWMLREVGKRDLSALKKFLKLHHKIMPRTMLRYAIEKFSPEERSKYLRGEIK